MNNNIVNFWINMKKIILKGNLLHSLYGTSNPIALQKMTVYNDINHIISQTKL